MGIILFGFRDSDRRDKQNLNDPNNLMIPPNLSGFNRVIITLPNSLKIDDILADLVEEGYLNGVEEHELCEDHHYVIKRENELKSRELINFLNNKYGYIACKGYVKPTRNIVIDKGKYGTTTTDVAKSTHVALVQSPEAKNPNDQFSAFRREYDPDSEFPKFERVDIEEIIHYQRPEDIVNNKNNFANMSVNTTGLNVGLNNNQSSVANAALDAMARGEHFDVTETEAVKDRDAVKIDYVEKARKLRLQLKNTKLRKLKSKKAKHRIQQQFKYDHMKKLIELKQKKYGINRAKRIYKIQREQRLSIAKLKQEIDPNFEHTEYDKHQIKFWEEFDYTTK